ncbi:ARID DNA-binding domain-containing protein [Tanacetum coccineum]
MSQSEFAQRHIKREKEERIGKCIRQITRDCKNMLRKKIEEIEVYNSTISQNRYKQYNCFYCNQKGHIFKSCPAKIKNEVEHAQGLPTEIAKGNIEANNTTQAKITQNKNMVLCFKCQEYGHFANKCTSKKQWEPKVSLKYPEFIHFKTRGIIKGTDKVLIKEESNGYLIPGVHYAPEITLNILSINVLKQHGFEIIFEGDKCTLEYMFKNQQGQNMDVDKMRHRHNDYLDDYFESLDKEKTDRFGQEFGALAEILGLPRSDGEEIRKCYMTYLDVFISYYKTARAPEDPTKVEEDTESLESYQWNSGKTGAPIAEEKEKKKLEHFGIKLEEEEDCKEQQSAYYGKDQSQVICYRCQSSGHYAFECPNKNRKKDQVKYSSYKEASTSKLSGKGDSHSTSSDDYIVIT